MPFEVGHRPIKPKPSTIIGRPKKSKNLLPVIRDKVLQTLEYRLNIKKELKHIPTNELLKFAQSIMPKDLSLRIAPVIHYISNTPRPQVIDVTPNTVTPTLDRVGEELVKDEIANTLEEDS